MHDAQGATAAGGRAWWEVPARPEHLRELRSDVCEFARAQGAGDEEVAAIALAVTEAATNAVVHAFVGQEPGTVCVEAGTGPDELRFRVVDDGRGMQPRPDSPGLGLGLPTIAKLTTRMDVREGDGGHGTVVAMAFAVPGVRGPADEEPTARELRLLAEAGTLAEPGGWHGLRIERLADLVVGELADACTIDVVGEDGPFRRIAARVDGDDELEAWLAGNLPVEHERSPFFRALRDGAPVLVDIDPDRPPADPVAAEAHARARRLGVRWWLAVPLPAGRRVLGVVGAGGRVGRPRPDQATVELVAELARRAAVGLADARLLTELQRTHRRFERILSVLAEAVTVSDAEGRLVYANPAAAELLGARSVEELLAAQPGALAARFDTTLPDGSPLRVEDLPGRRVLAGQPAEPLLVRAVEKATGRVRWTRTKSTLLEDEGRFAVNIVEDVTDEHEPPGA